MKKENKKLYFWLGIILILFLFFFCTTSNIFLVGKIKWNLWKKYGTRFECESLIVEGNAANFTAYPRYDSALRFNGLADSRDGSIEFDEYVGAIIAKEDTRVISEMLGDALGESFVYGSPVIRNGRFVGQYEAEMIKDGSYTLEQLYRLSSGYKFFYIVINVTDDRYVYNPGAEYDLLEQTINEMSKTYYERYGKDVCADLHIYFVDEELFDYSKEYFNTHTETTHDFNLRVSPNYLLVIEMGPLEEYSSNNIRLTREQYIEQREEIKERERR